MTHGFDIIFIMKDAWKLIAVLAVIVVLVIVAYSFEKRSGGTGTGKQENAPKSGGTAGEQAGNNEGGGEYIIKGEKPDLTLDGAALTLGASVFLTQTAFKKFEATLTPAKLCDIGSSS